MLLTTFHRTLWLLVVLLACFPQPNVAFAPLHHLNRHPTPVAVASVQHHPTELRSVVQDLDIVGLVAGQENYGLAAVCVGEALWSFLNAPSLDHVKVLLPAAIATVVLVALSGPMITSGDAATVGTGLWIATGVSLGLGVSYVARMVAPYSPSPKEIAFLGLIVAVAGFFSFSQNLVVDGFVTLPSLPSLPSLPEISLPEFKFDF
jgi:hypothetical protein